jgi:hypothetical protein
MEANRKHSTIYIWRRKDSAAIGGAVEPKEERRK